MDSEILKILLVDDDKEDYLITKELLSEVERSRYQLEWVANYDDGLEAVLRKAHDVYLMDYRLGERTGLELLQEAIRGGCSAPIILLTGQGAQEVDIKAMEAGAADYLVKGNMDAFLLERSIRYALERKRVEEELRQSQKQLVKQHEELNRYFRQVEIAKKEWEATMDCIGDMVVLLDSKGRIKRCNKAFKDFSGRAFTELLDQEWEGLLSKYQMTTGSYYGQGVELFHNPTRRWFVLNSYPYSGSQGSEVSGSVITLHDSTELKKITSDLEEAYNKLKEAQSQMLQREKMASIGQLAAGVAHEINNPMGFISSNISTLGSYVEKLTKFITIQTEIIKTMGEPLVERELNEKKQALKIDYVVSDVRDLIGESLEGAERVKKIVEGLKSFSRVDEADYKHANINECLESTLNIVWNELKYKVTIHKEYGEIPLTRCYPQQLNQVFMNLLVNAGHAIEKQGEITITTWNGDDSIFILIADTGAGIPEDKIHRIFEPFFTTKGVGRGTGLGLSITYEIMEKHGGEIRVESEVGKGTTFTLRIPVVEGV